MPRIIKYVLVIGNYIPDDDYDPDHVYHVPGYTTPKGQCAELTTVIAVYQESALADKRREYHKRYPEKLVCPYVLTLQSTSHYLQHQEAKYKVLLVARRAGWVGPE